MDHSQNVLHIKWRKIWLSEQASGSDYWPDFGSVKNEMICKGFVFIWKDSGKENEELIKFSRNVWGKQNISKITRKTARSIFELLTSDHHTTSFSFISICCVMFMMLRNLLKHPSAILN